MAITSKMPVADYATFLAGKAKLADAVGHAITAADCHPLLHEWQQSIVAWAVKRGRAAIFADCGLGKTFMQIEWARLSADTTLILAPLSVARQTVRESAKIDVDVRYVRHQDDVTGPGVWITNYEMADKFDAGAFGAVVLDESSILKNAMGSTRTKLIRQWQQCPRRLACTATPAPNDVQELCNHAEFLGAMPRNEMLAAYFIHDDDGWRLKGHAHEPMFRWMATWAVAIRKPSDLGYLDVGYDLPPLTIHAVTVDVAMESEGQLFPTDLGGIGGRSKVRKHTLDARVDAAVAVADSFADQCIVWCGLNDEATNITKALPDAVNVSGSMSPEDKAEALEAFQDGKYRVLVTKPSIAGFGMNFQNAHRMIFLGMSDSYEAYYQSIRRCWRFGQTDPVDAWIVVSELEQAIVTNVREKERSASTVTESLIRHMNDDIKEIAS